MAKKTKKIETPIDQRETFVSIQKSFADSDLSVEEKLKTYQFDPHLDPTLQWAGKAESMNFRVPTSSIHIHESIKPLNIIARVTREYSDAEEGQLKGQLGFFEFAFCLIAGGG